MSMKDYNRRYFQRQFNEEVLEAIKQIKLEIELISEKKSSLDYHIERLCVCIGKIVASSE